MVKAKVCSFYWRHNTPQIWAAVSGVTVKHFALERVTFAPYRYQSYNTQPPRYTFRHLNKRCRKQWSNTLITTATDITTSTATAPHNVSLICLCIVCSDLQTSTSISQLSCFPLVLILSGELRLKFSIPFNKRNNHLNLKLVQTEPSQPSDLLEQRDTHCVQRSIRTILSASSTIFCLTFLAVCKSCQENVLQKNISISSTKFKYSNKKNVTYIAVNKYNQENVITNKIK